MSADPSQLDALREALAQSPENVPLRQMVAEALLSLGRHEEAEKEFRAALARAPQQLRLTVGLAQAFFAGGKFDEAAVALEPLLARADAPARAHLLQARLLARRGDAAARDHYERAVAAEPALRDATLESSLPGVASPRPARAARPPAAPAGAPDESRARRVAHEADEGPDEVADDDLTFSIEAPDVTFAEVGGMEELKDEIRMKILLPLEKPELFAHYGKKAGGGILLYGPPGCGKTWLARATAGEAHCGFLAIGIHEILDKWIGESERRLHSVFERARRRAPCILFFDEVDALAASRSDLRQSALRITINQFLAELDGMHGKNEGVLVLAATNAPWHVDAAFRRPGRFDRVLFVPPPDDGARAAVLRVLLRDRPARDVDVEAVAKKTRGWSCADLRGIVDGAIEAKLREAMKGGAPTPLATADLLGAMKGRRPSIGDWLQTARNYALYANQGGEYDDVLRHLGMK